MRFGMQDGIKVPMGRAKVRPTASATLSPREPWGPLA
jgi:hypothetical protein